jgi:(1->4)-alpha-D-glucan 1-alpha-D-glucosylmutase
MIYRALNARHRFHALFADGSYVPLRAIGKQREHIVAFLRRHGDQWALSVVPRFMVGLLKSGQYIAGTDVWGDTALPLPDEAPHTWTDAITGNNVSSVDRIAAVDALRSFPVSLLLSEKQERGEV